MREAELIVELIPTPSSKRGLPEFRTLLSEVLIEGRPDVS
jgi:hypothetical protein